jgi:hypothetical protein
MSALRHALANLCAFLRGFVGATAFGANPREELSEHARRRGRCC